MSEHTFGNRPWCNRDPSAAPHVRGYCAPLCWRCIGIVCGAVAGVSVGVQAPIHVAAALAMPCVIHGTARYVFGVHVSNAGRLVTGLLLGIAIAIVDRQTSAMLMY